MRGARESGSEYLLELRTEMHGSSYDKFVLVPKFFVLCQMGTCVKVGCDGIPNVILGGVSECIDCVTKSVSFLQLNAQHSILFPVLAEAQGVSPV